MNIILRFSSIILPFSVLTMTPVVHGAPLSGLTEGKLNPCPESPNCVCSENNPADALQFKDDDSQQVWQKLLQIIIEQGGEIIEDSGTYLHAEFHSKWMKFIDDLEARVDTENKVIHLRSASRTGYYDFGVNRKRVDTIKKKMHYSFQNENSK